METFADHFIDLPDMDKSIFRVLDFNHLKDLFERRKLVLSRPGKWEDPFENVLLKLRVVTIPSGDEIGIRGGLDIFFGQCWSDRPEETDATWRIYAPHSNGVRISTTPRKLFDAILSAPDRPQSTSVFIGKVRYESAEHIVDYISDPSRARDVILSANGQAAARWLLIKRTEFEHEEEVRLLVRDPGQTLALLYEPHCEFSVDPFALIDDVVFDPRMPEYRFKVFRDQLMVLGVSVPMRRSTLYSLPDVTVQIDIRDIEREPKQSIEQTNSGD
jgi:hypothetical protein